MPTIHENLIAQALLSLLPDQAKESQVKDSLCDIIRIKPIIFEKDLLELLNLTAETYKAIKNQHAYFDGTQPFIDAHPNCSSTPIDYIQMLYDAVTIENQITVANLSNNKLDDAAVQKLITLLNSPNCKLQALDFSQCIFVTDQAAMNLGKAIACSTKLISVNFNCSNFSAKNGALALFRNMTAQSKPSLQWLGLRRNQLENCMDELRRSIDGSVFPLRGIDLSLCQMGEEELNNFAEVAQHRNCNLTQINLNGVISNAAELENVLVALPKLSCLHIGGPGIHGSNIQLLTTTLQNSEIQLEELKIESANITDADLHALLEVIAANKTIKSLGIRGFANPSTVAPVLVEFLANSELQYFDLSDSSLQSKDLAVIFDSNTKLSKLDLRSNELDDHAIAELAKHIRSADSTITIIFLGANQKFPAISETQQSSLQKAVNFRLVAESQVCEIYVWDKRTVVPSLVSCVEYELKHLNVEHSFLQIAIENNNFSAFSYILKNVVSQHANIAESRRLITNLINLCHKHDKPGFAKSQFRDSLLEAYSIIRVKDQREVFQITGFFILLLSKLINMDHYKKENKIIAADNLFHKRAILNSIEKKAANQGLLGKINHLIKPGLNITP